MSANWHIDDVSLREVCDDVAALESQLAIADAADRVFILRILGRLDAALAEGSELLAGAADPFRPLLLLADVHRWRGSYTESAVLQERALEIARDTPREAVTRQHIGKRLFDEERFGEARDQLAEALRLRILANSSPDLIESSRQALARSTELVPRPGLGE